MPRYGTSQLTISGQVEGLPPSYLNVTYDAPSRANGGNVAEEDVVTVFGTLENGSGAGINGERVYLGRGGASRDSVITSGSGNFSLQDIIPSGTVEYSVYWNGNSSYEPVNQNFFITAELRTPQITGDLLPDPSNYGQSRTVSGYLIDTEAIGGMPIGNHVINIDRSRDNSNWTIVGNATTNSSGVYSRVDSATISEGTVYYRITHNEQSGSTRYGLGQVVLQGEILPGEGGTNWKKIAIIAGIVGAIGTTAYVLKKRKK